MTKEPMKILHVNKFFDLRGGAEFYLHALMAKQTAAGHEVHAFATRSEKDLPSVDRDYFVHRFSYDKQEGPLIDAKKAVNYIWNREAEKSFERMLREVKPDVIHLHNIYHHLSTSILRAVRRSGVRCVQTLHDYKLACPNYKMFTEGKPCERCKGGHYSQAIRHNCQNGFFPSLLAATEMGLTKFGQSYERTVSTFICPSQFLLDKMIAWGEPPSKFVHLANPVELRHSAKRTFSEADIQRSGHSTSQPYVYIGRLSQEKGVETLVRAFARMTSIELEIIGQGPEGLMLERLAKELGAANIRFLGFMSGDELAKHRMESRALLMPTLMYENSSLAILEALADGVPVIASDVGGIPELVQDGINGFLVKPGSVDDWFEAINQIEDFTQEQIKEMGEAGNAIAKNNHNWEDHLKKLDGIYKL
jgi:glycosyltransferase involved in cell wall biosynthesis